MAGQGPDEGAHSGRTRLRGGGVWLVDPGEEVRNDRRERLASGAGIGLRPPDQAGVKAQGELGLHVEAPWTRRTTNANIVRQSGGSRKRGRGARSCRRRQVSARPASAGRASAS